ncbi:SMP-30/gluconolactonase/LRE family protein [Erythrobacter sp. WG]|uniref:SMP-30/gluconolactonase/LRE family protein n=1 Tax=Erythrobacter sp. WG TaxID=2985510 RepID=UPI00227081EB|nr:SMP-30/gluconolactonase/LRE family protein [Erythrobacter sp. WG]MCX9147929.1 SMP-30/gluconolactonase/LRE family protein [Erythrobacter sp. WG]
MSGAAECLADVGARLGEGPVWVAAEQALYWVDILGSRAFRWHAHEGLRDIAVERPACSLLPRASGGFIGGGYDGFIAVDADFAVAVLADPEPDHPGNRFNDGKIDRAGRLWAGTMDRAERAASGSLYRMDRDLSWRRIDSGYRVTNGPAFSRNGRVMYHTDSARQTVYAFDLAEDGSVGERRVHLQFGEGDGYPDGMTVDAEDCLWIAFWDGWCVRRFSPAGERLAQLAVPVQRPTSVAFGGAGLDELFVTSAARDLTPEELEAQPQAGGLFRLRPGVTGIAELPFAG